MISTALIAQNARLPGRYEPLGRLNVVCPYFTMFPLDFPHKVLRHANTDSCVLDPFCGRGTTLFAARLLQLRCIGIDSNPIAAAIAASKLASTTATQVIERCRNIFQHSPKEIDVPEGDFWSWCYHPSTLIEICILRDHLRSKTLDDTDLVLRAIVLGILHGPLVKGLPTYLSNQMPRTYATKPESAVEYWEHRSLRARRVDTLKAIQRRALYVLENLPPRTPGRVINGDVRTVHCHWKPTVTHVITSPPYLGMRGYVPDQWLRNWFLGLSENVEYDQSTQLGVENRRLFVKQLGGVWKRFTSVCKPRAKLAVRFGAIPSLEEDPAEVIRESLHTSGAPWQITTVRALEAPTRARRQATQFGSTSAALNEVDVYARLEA